MLTKRFILNTILIVSTFTPTSSLNIPSNKLRSVLNNRKSGSAAILLPGIHDAISAKIFSNQGAHGLFLSGFGVSTTKAMPDIGLLTQTEMENTLRSIIQTVDIPVIVDGDTGYGGAPNIRRTIRSFASAGACAVTIEDQKFPKKCTYAAGQGVNIIPRDESLSRIKMALKAKDEARDIDHKDIIIIARTDCRAALGFDEALYRCKMYEDLGAEIVYAENLQTRQEYEILSKELEPTTKTILAQLQTGQEDQNLWNINEIGEMGYDLALFGVTPLQAYIQNLQECASAMMGKGGLVSDGVRLCSFDNLKEIAGFADYENFSRD